MDIPLDVEYYCYEKQLLSPVSNQWPLFLATYAFITCFKEMFNSIKKYFHHYLLEEDVSSAESSEHKLQVATAALLIETIYADNEIKPVEKSETIRIIQQQFQLTEDEAGELIDLGEKQVQESTDYYQFTHLINQYYSQEQKLQIIEALWKVALADNDLDKFEEYTIRKIADLLYLPHDQFIAAKLKVI